MLFQTDHPRVHPFLYACQPGEEVDDTLPFELFSDGIARSLYIPMPDPTARVDADFANNVSSGSLIVCQCPGQTAPEHPPPQLRLDSLAHQPTAQMVRPAATEASRLDAVLLGLGTEQHLLRLAPGRVKDLVATKLGVSADTVYLHRLLTPFSDMCVAGHLVGSCFAYRLLHVTPVLPHSVGVFFDARPQGRPALRLPLACQPTGFAAANPASAPGDCAGCIPPTCCLGTSDMLGHCNYRSFAWSGPSGMVGTH